MSTGEEPEDPYVVWLVGQGVNPNSEEERARFFEMYLMDTTAWDGTEE